jgi:argininosuccinate lyase
MLNNISVSKDILKEEKYKYIFTVEAVNQLVNKGIPFRDAYRQVGNQVNDGTFHFDPSQPLQHTHEGSLGNLMNEEIVEAMEKVMTKFNQ